MSTVTGNMMECVYLKRGDPLMTGMDRDDRVMHCNSNATQVLLIYTDFTERLCQRRGEAKDMSV